MRLSWANQLVQKRGQAMALSGGTNLRAACGQRETCAEKRETGDGLFAAAAGGEEAEVWRGGGGWDGAVMLAARANQTGER